MSLWEGVQNTMRLIRFARQVVQGVISQLSQQLNVVEQGALAPMRMMVQAVTGGIWRGRGADAFVEEVSSLMIPGVGVVGQHIRMVQGNLQRASDIIDRADQQANTIVNAVGDIFEGIY